MDRATKAAISQVGLACAVVDRAGALIDVVMSVERNINLYQAYHFQLGLDCNEVQVVCMINICNLPQKERTDKSTDDAHVHHK